MAETSRPWGGIVLGDSGAYSDDQWTDIWERFLGALADADTGVLSNVTNELEATGVATPIAVDTGVAMVDGTFYINTVSVNVVIATPIVLTRIDRIVLRKSWAAQTVRITLIAGAEGGAAPALVQNDGVTWDMPLFQASITIGGVITLTDERERLWVRTPAMTEAQRDAMTAVDGMMAYSETNNRFEGYRDGVWQPLGVTKGHVQIDAAGIIVANSYNVASITDTGAGDRTIVWDKDFVNANYSAVTTIVNGTVHTPAHTTYAVGSVRLAIFDNAAALTDIASATIAAGVQ